MRFKDYINENSLSKVWNHMQKHDSGTITAFRDARECGDGQPYTKGENKARNKVLLASLLSKKFSITKVKGSYIENYGSKNEKQVGEDVFLVVDINDTGNLKKTLKKLGAEYEQDSILFIPKGGKEGILIGTNTCPDGFPGYGKIRKFGNPIFGKDGQMSTKVNGRPFILKEDFQHVKRPTNNMGKWAMNALVKGGWKKYYEENSDSLDNIIKFDQLTKFMNESTDEQMKQYRKLIDNADVDNLKRLVDGEMLND